MNTVLKLLGVSGLLVFLVVGGSLWWLSRGFVGDHYSWHQDIRLVIETPEGEVVGRSVQAAGVTFYPNGLFATGTERSYDLRGEAVVPDLGQGRYLFGLLGHGAWAETVYADLGERPARYSAIERQAGEPPRVLAPEAAPRLVTFGDVSDPTSVRAVDPDDLAATFGEGYALEAVTFGITRDVVTEGAVERVLGWLGSLDGGMLDGRKISTIEAENRLANDLTRVDFIR